MATSHLHHATPPHARGTDRSRRSELAGERRCSWRQLLTLVATLLLAMAGTIGFAQPAAAAVQYELVFSDSSDRAAPMTLEGATVDKSLYAFVAPETDVETVTFYLDDPDMSGPPRSTEQNPPFDFNGGNETVAFAFDTRNVSNGPHTITAVVDTTSGSTTVEATFTVDNPDAYHLMFSETADRADPMPLEGAVVTGQLYAFTEPDSDVQSVQFFIDDQDMVGAPHTIENTAPFDLGGGTADLSNGFDTTSLSEGYHVLTAAVTTSVETMIVHAAFNVDNNATPPPTPADFDVVVSETADRAGEQALNGMTVDGDVFVFVMPETDVETVAFYVNDPERSDAPFTTDDTAPFDLVGGDATAALAFDTNDLPDGEHVVTAWIVTVEGATTIDATFTVDNSAEPPPVDDESDLVPLTPARLADSRPGTSTIDGIDQAFGRLAAGAVKEIQVTGRGGVPADAAAALFNVTAVRPDATGYLTVYACDDPRPLASNVNYFAGGIEPNAVLAKLSATGTVCIYTFAATELVVDVNGHVPAGSSVSPLTGARLADSRPGHSTIDGGAQGFGYQAAGSITEIQVTGRGGVPADAAAALFNVTAVRPDATGYLTVYACDDPRPLASNVNYFAGGIEPNAVLAELSATGTVCIYTFAAAHLVVDVNAYVPAGSSVTPLTPARLADSRPGHSTIDGIDQAFGRLAAGAVKEIQVTGRGGVPADAAAVLLNVTAVRPDATGYLTVYACDDPRPLASNVNYFAGGIEPNAVLAKLSATGTVCIYTFAATELVVDVNGATS
jgi:hypothetical protein